jgi:hypothetical protein
MRRDSLGIGGNVRPDRGERALVYSHLKVLVQPVDYSRDYWCLLLLVVIFRSAEMPCL